MERRARMSLMEIKFFKENMAAGLDSNQSMTLWGALTEHNLVIFHDNDVSAFANVFMVCIDVSSIYGIWVIM